MKILGKNPSGTFRERVKASPNFRDGAFRNIVPTVTIREGVNYFELITDMFRHVSDRIPKAAIPSVRRNLYAHTNGDPVITWFGHSSYHIALHEKHILVDPVFCGYASPFSFSVKSFPGTDIFTPADFEQIDVLILTHDHYDHLDYHTLLKLKPKVKKVICSLGVGQHLVYWDYDPAIISELDWWDTFVDGDLKITAAPARHFSGRTFKRAQTLWSAFVIESQVVKIYAGGDSGYGNHFAETGDKFKGFDLAILDSGQYNFKWPYIHMNPEEAVQAGIDLGAKVIMPVHWGKFALAFHSWYEPAERFLKEVKSKHINYVMPKIGEAVEPGKNSNSVIPWWRE